MVLWGLNTCRNLATWKVRGLISFRKWPRLIEKVLKHHLLRVCWLIFLLVFSAILKLPSRCNLAYLIDVNVFVKEFSR